MGAGVTVRVSTSAPTVAGVTDVSRASAIVPRPSEMRMRSPVEARRTTARWRASSPSMVSRSASRPAGSAKKKGAWPLIAILLWVLRGKYERYSPKDDSCRAVPGVSAVQGGADLAEQALLLLDVLPPDRGEAPEELGLLVAHVGRDLDADLDEEIAPARPAEAGDALALQPHDLAGLGAGRDGH